MGLATAQARFLCITARKADCEYKSTEIAQQKLEITNQLSGVSAEYAQAMNATKFVWQNDSVDQDYGVTYSLLMSPSPANNFNPYFVTTPAGAVILNSEYATAAKAAGISKAGGIGSQDQRDRFIAALVPGGIVTQETANSITKKDYIATNKNGSITFENLTQTADRTQATYNNNYITWNSAAGLGAAPMDKASIDMMDLSGLITSKSIGKKQIDWAQLYMTDSQISSIEFQQKLDEYDEQINNARLLYQNETDETQKAIIEEEFNKIKEERQKYYDDNIANVQDFDASKFQTSEGKIANNGFTVVENGVINRYEEEIKEMSIGDILSRDIVLMTTTKGSDVTKFSDNIKQLMESIAKIFGLGQLGVGLNVDDASNDALQYAMDMVENKYLRPSNAITKGTRGSSKSMTENSAFINATEYNRLSNTQGFIGVSLSNMLSSFLTYYDNYLMGNKSNFVVGVSTDTSSYVTDSTSYTYIGQTAGVEVGMMERNADFFDQVYNNICEHGWREDAAIQDNEYLESKLKDGRYSMSSLNNDGYFYQTRYNETGYLVEMTDEDAIARAEAEFTQKKAELTYKEDSIDLKTKKLDAEISTLTSEYDTVSKLISKHIEKAFTMFSS